ncbi:uncharacterized protein LOC117342119 [Pecten maximus]|uniref:uncharacterized protein LOC117342119 n=1 Tax=Pecten maximus TaxID=6579 RepID=UPI00145853AA|nr:uncharacterized protein LOC117342119 [Pecten maximus]XP_033760013.1 uncharacterized protein LOC117342119 [Pecten maximus]
MEDPRVKLVIDRSYEFLRRHLVVTVTLIDRLYDADIINNYTRHALIGQSDQAQIATLIGILRVRSLGMFRKFITILRLCNDGWIADSLLNTPIQEAWGKGAGRTLGKETSMRAYVEQPVSLDITGLADAYVCKRDATPSLQHRRDVDLVEKYSLSKPYMSDMELLPYRSYIPAIPARVNSPYLTSQIVSSDYFAPVRQPLAYQNRYAYDDLARVPRHVEEVHKTLQAQRVGASKALADLRREELEMKSALESNVRDQNNLYHNQRLLSDLDHRLHQIETDAGRLKLGPISNTRVSYKVEPVISTPWAYKTYRY